MKGLPPEVDLRALPKVELHVHLEGSVPAALLRRMADRHGRTVPPLPVRGRRFEDFVQAWVGVTECLRDADDFRQAALALGRRARRDGIQYLEVFFSPEPFVRKTGISFDEILGGMNEGRREAQRRWGVEMRWIADGVRCSSTGTKSVERLVDWLLRLHGEDHGVVGLGLGGREVGFPCERFVDAFADAARAGFHLVAHAGETDGPRSIWNALEFLRVERIGHGVRCVEDDGLVSHLAASAVPLEICPTSNLRTGAVSQRRRHPVAALDARGVRVTLGSDDPAMFGATLTGEYRFLTRAFGYRPADLVRIARNGVDACFLPADEKARLRARFESALQAWCADRMPGGITGEIQ